MPKQKTEDGHTISQQLTRFQRFRYILVLEGIGVGAVAGLVTIAFRITLLGADDLLRAALDFGSRHPWFIPLWFLILLAAAGAVTLLLRWEPLISGSGIPQVEGEMQDRLHQTWWRVLLAKFAGGVLSIGAGLSLGREGPSIQLGAMAGKGAARLAKRDRTEEKLLITCGASAGLSAAFNAPLAGVLFSLEEVHKNFSVEVLLSAMASSITADFLSRNVFGLKPVFDFSAAQMMPLHQYWLVILLGLLTGLLGAAYNFCVQKAQDLYGRIRRPYLKTALPFLLAGILGFTYPAVLGGGHDLVGQITAGMGLASLLVLFAVKFLFSMASFGAGVPGGIFLPLLVLGSLAGGVFSGVLSQWGLSVELPNFVILGMAGFFAAIVRAPVTGVILISEMTGSFSHLLTLSLVSLTAYAVADLLRAKPIYDQLLHRLLQKRAEPSSGAEAPEGRKVLVETPIHYGAAACGRKIGDIRWPEHSLIVSVRRGEEELVPAGDTELRAGDILAVLCDESRGGAVYDALEQHCRAVQPEMETRR
ncbi:MAG TPA: ClC family H(+)/Cl(-) exchange transporter [Firmicutes bacterium]|nr:ClC family H(+)/Cl(-) exchange transporter [Bacillota bacterium]